MRSDLVLAVLLGVGDRFLVFIPFGYDSDPNEDQERNRLDGDGRNDADGGTGHCASGSQML